MADGEQGFGTRAIHAGQRPDPTSGAVMTPIYQTSTYVQEAVGEPRGGHEYARVTNPTRGALEGNLASLEEGRHGAAFASGMAAIEAVVKGVLSQGDHVVCGANVYGGTDRLFRTVWSRFGLDFTYVDTSDVDALSDAIRPETHLLHDLDLDSIDFVDLAVTLEERTGLRLEEEELKSIRTVQDAVEVIHGALLRRGPRPA